MEENQEEKNQLISLAEAIKARVQSSEAKEKDVISRIAIVAEKNSKSLRHGDEMKKILEDCVASLGDTNSTGMCLKEKTSFALALECDSENISPFLRQLNKKSADDDNSSGDGGKNDEEDQTQPLFSAVRVCLIMEDIRTRDFPKFRSIDSTSEAEKNVDLDKEFGGDAVQAAKDLYERLVKCASSGTNNDAISNERLMKYARSVDFFTVEEFLECYDDPLDPVLESERVWPMPELN